MAKGGGAQCSSVISTRCCHQNSLQDTGASRLVEISSSIGGGLDGCLKSSGVVCSQAGVQSRRMLLGMCDRVLI